MRWLRAHRLLLVVYGFGLTLAARELADPDVQTGQPDDPDVYLEPEYNIADVSAALYPERSLSLYYSAYQASLCAALTDVETTACEERGAIEPGQVRQLLEQSLATGNRSNELAMYNYALVLLQERAPQSEVETAIRSWRIAHPGSGRPDPRAAWRQMSQRPSPTER